MALAALAPILGSLAAPAAFSGLGLSLSPLLASSIGAGLGTLAATGDPLKALEGGAMGFIGGGVGNKLMGGAGAAGAGAAATQLPAATEADLAQSAMAPAAASHGLLGGLTGGGLNGMIRGAMPGVFASSAITPNMGNGDLQKPVDMHAPGLRQYVRQKANPAPAGYQPGVDPEWNYLQPDTGYAMGGPVMSPMQATAQNMSPDQQLAAQLNQQAYANAMQNSGGRGYAMGGRVGAPSNSIDSRSLSWLNRTAMHEANPSPQMHPQKMMGIRAVAPMMGAHVPHAIGYDGGGPVMGQGDGSSDSIPATVDGNLPAMISTGEHIVPADAVSAIGNGSSSAGHKALTQMVHRARKAKTGKTSLPQRLNAMQIMPA